MHPQSHHQQTTTKQNEGKHTERMAVRAKYMTLDPNKNR
jgi:hypothetical protein